VVGHVQLPLVAKKLHLVRVTWVGVVEIRWTEFQVRATRRL